MKLKSKSFAIVGVLFVAACGSSAIGLGALSVLGSEFVQMFRSPLNGEPVDAQSVDIAAISYVTDPFNP